MNKISSVIAALIILTGVAIRCTHLFLIDLLHEPFRLGGLFVAFAHEISSRNFQLPVNIPCYSSGGIPYAYPPLGFYVESILLKLFPAQIFAVANLLPSFVSMLALGGASRFFYRSAGSWNVWSLAGLTAYALLPGAFYNQIEAAGLAEAFGSLALIVYFQLILTYQQKNDLAAAFYAGLGLAFCAISSPGSALGASLISLVLVLDTVISTRWTQKTKPYLELFCIGITGILLSAPYWLTVILKHGVGIFLTPVGMQYEVNGGVSALAKLQYTWFTYSILQQDGVYFWSVAILLGMGWLVWKRKLFLSLAFLALFSIPRENAWVTAFPAALLVAYGVADVLVPIVESLSVFTLRARIIAMWVALGLIMISMILQAFELINLQVRSSNWKLERAQIETLGKARELIPPAGQVIVIGNGGLREWSPYLLQREVLNTEFGLEWQPDEYRQIISVNQVLGDAENWQDVAQSIRLLTAQKQVYVVLDPKHLPAGFDVSEHEPFLVKMNTSELQIGVLDLP